MDARTWTVAKDLQREWLDQARKEQLAQLAREDQDCGPADRASPPARRSLVRGPLSLLRTVVALAHFG